MHKNNYKVNENEYCFIHIPKSGGTTFNFYLNHFNIKMATKLSLHHPVNNKYLDEKIVEKYKFITIIRNPINRCYSYYQMVKRSPNNYPHKKYSNNLENFMKNCWEVNNMATLYYAGIDCSKLQIINVNDDIYNMAINNLKKFYYIIDFNNLENGLINFFKKINKEIIEININKRYHNYNKNISENDIELISKYNYYDIKLYNFIINYLKI